MRDLATSDNKANIFACWHRIVDCGEPWRPFTPARNSWGAGPQHSGLVDIRAPCSTFAQCIHLE